MGEVIEELNKAAVHVAHSRPGSDRGLARIVLPSAVRYARGRLGRSGDGFEFADRVAADSTCSIIVAARSYHDVATPFGVIAYGICRGAVDTAEHGSGGTRPGEGGVFAALSSEEREVLVLRVVLQLSLADTSLLLQTSPERIRILQHRALSRLRDRRVPS